MRPPAVTCRDCGFAWRSRAMADGLRTLGSCPRCRGRLAFAPDALAAEPAPAPRDAARQDAAPHLVLGIPRR